MGKFPLRRAFNKSWDKDNNKFLKVEARASLGNKESANSKVKFSQGREASSSQGKDKEFSSSAPVSKVKVKVGSFSPAFSNNKALE